MRQNFVHIVIQVSSVLIVMIGAQVSVAANIMPIPLEIQVLLIGLLAFFVARLARQPLWWRCIHLLFVPLVYIVLGLDVSPAIYQGIFVFLLLTYWGSLTGRVPLYLSNKTTSAAIAKIIRDNGVTSVIDLGAGIGSVLIDIEHSISDLECEGVENAPLVWMLGAINLRIRGMRGISWTFGSMWNADLSRYGLVYSYLSPEPMDELWKKVKREMAPGSLFISNSFNVPGAEPEFVVDVKDRRCTRLYCYKI